MAAKGEQHLAAGLRRPWPPPVHLVEDQIGGQLDAGFVLTGLYEDLNPGHPLARLLPTSVATRAAKPGTGPGLVRG